MATSKTETVTTTPGGTLRLRGYDDSVGTSTIESEQGEYQRRGDREYPRPYDGSNPEGWPTDAGMPDYRPLMGNDGSTRPLGATPDARVFVSLMMTGVYVIGAVNSAWRKTVGRVAPGAWTYPVGGNF